MSPVKAGTAYINVEYDPTSISKLRATTAAEGNRMSSSWSKTAGKLKSVGASLTKHVTLPLVAVGAVSVKVAADFDSSMSKIQGLVGANRKEMDLYRKSILALAPAVAQGPTALADALYFVTSSGFKGKQALDILAKSAKGSTAGLGETKTIADLVTSAITAYGSKALDAAHATDVLVAATKAGKGDPAEFAAALQENVAAADTLGISFDQLAAATAALSTVNSNVSQDATQLSGIMQAIIKPGKEAVSTLQDVGLSVGGLRKEVKDKGLIATLIDLKKRFHGNVTEMGKLFPNVRGLRGFLTLVGKAAQRNVSIFDQVAHSTGSLNKAFKTALTTDPTAKYHKMTAQLQVLAIIIGETLIPVLLKLGGWLTSIANKFKGLSGGQQTFVLITAGILAAIGPLISLSTNIATLFVNIYKLAKVLKIVTALQWLWNAAMTANPIGLIIIGVAALVVGLVVLYKKSGTFREIVQGALHAVGKAVDWLLAHWKLLLAAIPLIGPLVYIVATRFQTFKKIVVGVFNFVKGVVSGFVDQIKKLPDRFAAVWDAIKSGASRGWQAIVSTVEHWINTLLTPVNAILGVLGVDTIHINTSSGSGGGGKPHGHPAHLADGGIVGMASGGVVGKGKSGIYRPVPGGVYKMVEAGHPEAVVPLDPSKRGRALDIINEILNRLKIAPQAANGGIMASIPTFGIGGVIGSVGGAIGSAASSVAGFTGDIIDIFTNPAAILKRLLPGIPNIGGIAGEIAMGLMHKVVDSVLHYVTGQAGKSMVGRALTEAQRMTSLHEPYLWGGGHAGFSANGPWDCSGAISQLLHAIGAPITSPLTSGGFMGWGKPGAGPITIYTNPEHVYSTIAGRTYGTSAENPGGGFGGPLSYGARPGFMTRTFGTGGIVPGSIGVPQPAIVHGGEGVFTPDQLKALGGDTYVTVMVDGKELESAAVRVQKRTATAVKAGRKWSQ